jgi:hypothetical protein
MTLENLYFAGTAEKALRAAQDLLNAHVTSSGTGRCLECDVPGPCPRRENAVVIFSRTLRLPKRLPGASRPELVGARRVGASSLLARPR